MSATKNIQASVAETILEHNNQIVLGGKRYSVAPPTLGTLIRASAMIARMPKRLTVTKEREYQDIMAQAKDYAPLANLVAILILGEKKAREIEPSSKGGWLSKRKEKAPQTREQALAREILDNVPASEIRGAIAPLMARLELDDFFVVTTFLNGINVTQPTKEKVEPEATVSGHRSGDSPSTTG